MTFGAHSNLIPNSLQFHMKSRKMCSRRVDKMQSFPKHSPSDPNVNKDLNNISER